MIIARLANLHVDGPPPRAWHEKLLRVVAELSLWRNGQLLWSESDFPILELASDLDRWVRETPDVPFIYESMESEEPEFLWFRRHGDLWEIGAGSERLADGVTHGELIEAARRFVGDAVAGTKADLGIDAENVISEAQARFE